MSRRERKQHKRNQNHGGSANHPVVRPAPNLRQERVVLTGLQELAGGSNGGAFNFILNGNGLSFNSTAFRVPQEQLFNQFAAMYEFYQVKKIHFKYVPYRLQGHGEASPVKVFNNYNIIQPDDIPALVGTAQVEPALFAFGNCIMHQGYQIVTREIKDYTNLGLSKQNEIILKTNGAAGSRQSYVKPASLGFYGTGTDFGTTTVGQVQFSLEYVFSGMKRPDVLSMPKMIQQIYAVESPQEQQQPKPVPVNPEQAARAEGILLAKFRKAMADEIAGVNHSDQE